MSDRPSSTYERFIFPRSNQRLVAGTTGSATHLVYDPRFDVEAFNSRQFSGPYYFAIPYNEEDNFLLSIAEYYADESHSKMRAVDEKVSIVFAPFLDIDKIPYSATFEEVQDYVHQLIKTVYFQTFKLGHRQTRRVLVLTSNPKHCARWFRYKGNRGAAAESYFERQGGFGLHIVFYDEDGVLREQYTAWTNYLKGKGPSPYSANIDAFTTQCNADCNIKLRLPLCDNGRKGYPRLPYVPMEHLKVMMDTDDGALRFVDMEEEQESLIAEEVMERGHLRRPKASLPYNNSTQAGRLNDFMPYYKTSTFVDSFNSYFASQYTPLFLSVRKRLIGACMPLTQRNNYVISLDKMPSDIYVNAKTIQDQLKILNNTIETRMHTSPMPTFANVPYIVKPVLDRCVELMNEVAFFTQNGQDIYYITYSSDLGIYNLKKADRSDDFGIKETIYMFKPTITAARKRSFNNRNEDPSIEVAPPGYKLFGGMDMAFKQQTFIEYWKAGHFLTVSDVIFDPSAAIGEGEKMLAAREDNRVVVNTFPGLKVNLTQLRERFEAVKQNRERLEILKGFRNFIRYVLIGGNIPEDFIESESTLYLSAFECWFKQLLVRPHHKTEVILSIRGDQGYGKSWLFETWIKCVYGSQAVLSITCSDPSYIFGNFTHPNLPTALMCYVDECSFNKDDKEQKKAKQITTGKTTTYNMKHKPQEQGSNYTNFCTTSNAVDNINVQAGDRRPYCLNTWTLPRFDERVKPYFSNFKNDKLRNNVSAYIAFLEKNDAFMDWVAYLASDLCNPVVNDPSFRLQMHIPKTFSYQDAISFHMDAYERYWRSCLMTRSFTKKDSISVGIKLQKKMFKDEEEEEAFKNDKDFKGDIGDLYLTMKEADDYYDKLSSLEREGYGEMNKGDDSNAEYFFTHVYNAQNHTWPRLVPLQYVMTELKEQNPAFRLSPEKMIHCVCKNIGANPAEFVSQVLVSRMIPIPDWLTCLKFFAANHQFSASYIQYLCRNASKHVPLAPWYTSDEIPIDLSDVRGPQAYTDSYREGSQGGDGEGHSQEKASEEEDGEIFTPSPSFEELEASYRDVVATPEPGVY